MTRKALLNVKKCGSCGEQLSEGAKCTACNQSLHYHCAGITEGGYRKLGDRKLSWRCHKCRQLNVGATQLPSSPRSPISESDSATQFDDIIKTFGAKIENMEQRIVQLQGVKVQVDDLQARLDKLDDEAESKDQWLRLNNIEVKGIPQSKNENLFEVITKIGQKINYPICKNPDKLSCTSAYA
ncbi:hypothetical protein SFRURICE_006159 [Spodoptera frugiperda]|nr:hypothetical protein SFRURICE_006159 [Spodoptera frugiperda]